MTGDVVVAQWNGRYYLAVENDVGVFVIAPNAKEMAKEYGAAFERAKEEKEKWTLPEPPK